MCDDVSITSTARCQVDMFAPVAESTGAMASDTGHCSTVLRLLYDCLLTDACEKDLRPPPCILVLPSAVASALFLLHRNRTPRIQGRSHSLQ